LDRRALIRTADPLSAASQGLKGHARDRGGLHLIAFATLMLGRMVKLLLGQRA
jgi:hypothetical protein